MKMPYGFQDFNKKPAAREKIFITRFLLVPGRKHEFEPEQRYFRHAIQKRRNSGTVLRNPPTVCGEIAEEFSEFIA
jgi:hypothetical protein